MPNYSNRDYDDTTRYPTEWWQTIGGEGPKPYATATWTFFQAVEEIEESEQGGG